MFGKVLNDWVGWIYDGPDTKKNYNICIKCVGDLSSLACEWNKYLRYAQEREQTIFVNRITVDKFWI